MPQEQSLDKFIQHMKKSRKRNGVLFVLWYVLMFVVYFTSSDSSLTSLFIANLSAVIALVGAEFSNQNSLIAVLNLLKENPTLKPDTEETPAS
ncbi:hypothetical protein [Gimesia sp.]|uniref:hypothetical protein n=1 Tax=Gimesia sp. TaxID=2024833 RepID=UPI003A950EC6